MLNNSDFLIYFEEQNTKKLHPFCYFSSNLFFSVDSFGLDTSGKYICTIKNKIFDEGIFKISINQIILEELNTFFSDIEATNICFIETINLSIGSVKQFQELYGKLIVKTTLTHPFS